MTDEEFKGLFEALRRENATMREESISAHGETRRHFDVAVEHIEKRFDFLAETVQHLNDELQRTGTSLDEKIERSAAETQSMIKFSHKELDRRVMALEEGQRGLEETVANLQVRLQRIESGTH
jgi:prefoldin subunit 5